MSYLVISHVTSVFTHTPFPCGLPLMLPFFIILSPLLLSFSLHSLVPGYIMRTIDYISNTFSISVYYNKTITDGHDIPAAISLMSSSLFKTVANIIAPGKRVWI